MKKLVFLSILLSVVFGMNVKAQEVEEKSNWDVGADLVSNYIWRGIKYGEGLNVQPYIGFSKGGWAIGAWGSADFNGFGEMDLYTSYGFDFGLSMGVTDYYYTGSPWSDFSTASGSHAFEINAGYEIGIVSLAGNYVVNEAAGGAGSMGGDTYFELGLNFKYFSFFGGGGNGWHTLDGGSDWELTNIGISSSKDIQLSDKFTLPLEVSAIMNPNADQFHVVVALSL
ncbi:MAG: TorF family putative porin [Mangrovibacterium sp.]